MANIKIKMVTTEGNKTKRETITVRSKKIK